MRAPLKDAKRAKGMFGLFAAATIVLCSCAERKASDTHLKGNWFGRAVWHCPDSIENGSKDTMHFSFVFLEPDSGVYQAYFGSDFKYPHLQGWLQRRKGSDTIELQHSSVTIQLIERCDSAVTLLSENPRNGCNCKFMMIPFEGDRPPLWQKPPEPE